MSPASSRLDDEQRLAVACAENVVVSAGAGSGKTTVLAERFVRLIREGRAEVDQILTLTFTRKAASEMNERIYSALLAETGPEAGKALASFDSSQISTLDSFCARIARDLSQRFGVARDFRVADETADPGMERLALRFVLDNHELPCLAEFIHVNGFEQVWKRLFARIANEYLSVAEERDFSAMAASQLRELGALLEKELARLRELFDGVGALDPAAKAILDSQRAIRGLPDLASLAERSKYAELKAAIGPLTLSQQTGRSGAAAVLLYKELVGEIRPLRDAIVEILDTLESSADLEGMLALLGRFQGEVLDHKRRTGLLSFRDVVEMAVAILGENRELRRYYATRYRYIMIDEFQDNNALQKRLLYLLAGRADPGPEPSPFDLEPGRLFFVGDEKQSIYRFRGADVSVFRGLSEELAAAGGRALRLRTNYRSSPLLVDFFNFLFPRVMANPGADFEARFEPLSYGSSEPRKAGSLSSVRLFYKPYAEERAPDAAEGDDAEAWYIARFIREQVTRGSLLIREGDGERPAGYDDFAVLMRSTSNQIRYERLFRRFGIPYAAQSVRTLFLEAPLNDLYCALELAVYPDDRTAYAALLRSPLVHLSDDSVARVLLRDADAFEELPGIEELGAEDLEKLKRGKRLVDHVRERADFAPLAELVHDLWHRFGYRYLLMRNRDYHPYIEYYDYFRSLAERFDEQGSPLSAFLDYIRPNLGKYERLPELSIVQDNPGGVQILTVHKAKGLEFPVVILANSGNSGRGSSEGSEPYFLSESHGVTLRVSSGGNYFYTLGKEESRRKDLAEAKRLLYVALTRARSHLVISGCHNLKNRPGTDARGQPKNEDVLLNMVLSGIGWSPEEPERRLAVPIEIIPDVTERDLFAGAVEGPKRQSEEALRALVDHYRSAPLAERRFPRTDWAATWLNELARERAEAGPARREPLPSVPSDPLIVRGKLGDAFGTLCHFVLQRALGGLPVEGTALPRELAEALEGSGRQALMRDALALAQRFLSSPLGVEALSAERETESAFLYRVESDGAECFVSGKLDLLFKRPGSRGAPGETIVVDFKTDRERIEGAYDAQLQIYRQAAEALTALPCRAYLFYLRDGFCREIDAPLDLPGLLSLARGDSPARQAALDGSG